jgi:hypothetical protein
MALYSVWDWDRNSWKVYQTRTPVSVGDDALPPKPHGTSVLGADPDTHVKPLPGGAKFHGYSHVARGEIRRSDGILGASGDDGGKPSRPWLMFGLGAVAATLFWWAKR